MFKSRQGTSFLTAGHWVVACALQQRRQVRCRARTHLESSAEPRLALWHKVFDPSACSLTKSQKLGLTASNSLRFAHRGGPFVSHGWVPQKPHDCRFPRLCKALDVQWRFMGLYGACPVAWLIGLVALCRRRSG
jgi:hypothetical protein